MAEPKTVSPPAAPQESPTMSGDPFTGRPLAASQKPPGWRIWLFRVRALLYVTVCATLGVLLLIVPWTPKWTDNPWLLSSPGLREYVSSGFVRGMVSGLGILDLWLGFWEAIHYHETPKESDH